VRVERNTGASSQPLDKVIDGRVGQRPSPGNQSDPWLTCGVSVLVSTV
jgi:hypothetical protein